MFAALQGRFPSDDLLLDIPPKPIGIHKLMLPSDADDTGVDMMLLSSEGGRRPVVRSSQIFSTLPKAFRPIRIFADVESGGQREEMRAYAEARWIQQGGTT